jgi:hypothetical protein
MASTVRVALAPPRCRAPCGGPVPPTGRRIAERFRRTMRGCAHRPAPCSDRWRHYGYNRRCDVVEIDGVEFERDGVQSTERECSVLIWAIIPHLT